MISSKANREKQHFNKLALLKGSQWWLSNTPAQLYRLKDRALLAADFLNLKENSSILEIGCSVGDFTKVLHEVAPNISITAVDISDKLIGLASRRIVSSKVNFEIADVELLKYPDNSFDAVVGYAILHHLNLDKALPQIKRVLKDNGRIFFAEPNMLNPQIFLERKCKFIGKLLDVSEDETAFLRWQIKKDIVSYGFSNIKVVPFDFLYPLTPKSMISLMGRVSSCLEKIYFIKEIAGSLLITAQKG